MQPDWKEIAEVVLDSILLRFAESKDIPLNEEGYTQEEIKEELARFVAKERTMAHPEDFGLEDPGYAGRFSSTEGRRMADYIGDFLASIQRYAEHVSDGLTEEELDYTGPESNADYSRLARVWRALKEADAATFAALDAIEPD